MSLLESNPSAHNFPDSPFSEKIAKPFELNRFCSGVIGFGFVNADTNGAIDTEISKNEIRKKFQVFLLFNNYLQQSFSSEPSGQSNLPSHRFDLETHERPRPQ